MPDEADVNKGVENGGANNNGSPSASSVEQELRDQIESLQKENIGLGAQFKELALSRFSPESRAAAEKVLDEIERKVDLDTREATLKAQAREIYVNQKILENSDLKLDKEALLKANTVTEVDLAIAKAQVEALTAKSKGEGEEGGKKDLSKMESDKGAGGGTSGGAGIQIEGKGRDAVAAHIGQLAAAKRGKS